MTSPSMQFAPAWLKKPSGTTSGGPPSSGGQSANPSLAFSQAVASAPSIGNLQHSSGMEDFPSSGMKQTQTGTSNPLGQSYSQIASPRNEFSSYPNQGLSSGIASASVQLSSVIDGSGSSGDNKARPFRYSREALLALFDEEKARERPLELMEWAMHPNNSSGHAGAEEGGIASIILSEKVGIPMGLVEWTSEEKKLFANPIRRQPAHPDRMDSSLSTTLSSRRNGHLAGTGETRTPGGRGFGRGEGGAFGGGSGGVRYTPSGGTIMSDYIAAGTEDRRAPGAGERLPWTPGGGKLRDPIPATAADAGFGAGRGDRTGLTGERRSLRGTARRGEVPEAGVEASPRLSAAIGGQGSWRPNIRSTPAAGSFEGVLGFSGTSTNKPQGDIAAAEANAAPSAANGWRDRTDGSSNGIVPSAGGGPASTWGKGRWRAAALEREATDRDTPEKRPALAALIKEDAAGNPQHSESMVVMPPGTPVEQRDQQAGFADSPAQAGTGQSASSPATPSGGDPRSIKWFYTDPSGQQQGPFDATNMQNWYAANYFIDTLPLRREHETSYRTLAVLKEETASAAEPFLTPSVPKMPPNLPLPASSQSQSEHTGHKGLNAGMSDMIGSLSQTASPRLTSGQQTPHRNESLFAGASPAFGQANINRSTDPFSGTASFHSSPVVQHGLPVRGAWDNAVASPAISRPTFGGIYQQEIPQVQHQQQYGAFSPQPQYGQARSVFESPQIQFPFAQVPPPVQSPWLSQPAGPLQHIMPAQIYASSPFQQPMQSPYQQYAGPVPSVLPWQGTPTPQSAVVQPHQQQMQQSSFTSAQVPASEELATLGHEQPSAAESVLSPVQSQDVPRQQASQDHVGSQASVQPASTSQDVSVTQQATSPAQEVEAKPEVFAPVSIASPMQVPAVKETKTKINAKKSAKTAPVIEKQATLEATPEYEVQAVQSDAATDSPAAAASPSVAPWANKEDEKAKAQTGPSLRDIQEAEAKAAESRRHEAKAKATTSKVATSNTVPESEASQTLSWGLPSRTGGVAAQAMAVPPPSSSPAPVWGSSDAAPKKTLKQIQEEEQRRARAATQAKAGASPAAVSQQGKRGYADLAAAQAPQPTSGGVWSTVGASGKVGAAAPAAGTKSKPTATPLMSVIPVKPASSVSKTAKSSTNLDDVAPSVDFIRWCKEALKGLKVNMDEFIQMLLTFPVEPGAAGRADLLEIISDSVYANSSTLDGRRFAQEFYTKRKADAQNRLANGSQAPSKINSLADIVKTQPKAASSDFGGFKVVKAKGKGRK
ncbi:hypothetical protein QFC22_000985 [Naganishia vaughanmartiniae]|uniref:Uncharacterized protein n=1 Tax=Naganishia vaughanmartiniae TaxID=1424756 RepID=A0ACC2XKN1_9TREE|nr:hypothetical protein QFC22_000985 [Naganishia vaughanmartiniae]